MRPDLNRENLIYQKLLWDPILGEPGRKYLEQRGINEETIKKWQIGFSPENYIVEVFSKDDPYNLHLKMQNRITFPIFDLYNNIISISGRLIIKSDKPKYDMYPFPRNRTLFGLSNNKYNIRKQNHSIVTEGQLDVITAWQSGIDIVTSSFGAHCNMNHLALVARYCSNIDIIYDNDNAGKTGTEAIRELSTFGDLNVNLKLGIFPNGEDMDSFLKKHSREEFYELIKK